MNSPHILEGCPLNHPRIGRYGMKIAGYPGIMTFRFPSRVIRTRTGFTIVELMIVIAIIVIGAAIGIPAYNITIRPTADLKGAARRLYSDMQLANM